MKYNALFNFIKILQAVEIVKTNAMMRTFHQSPTPFIAYSEVSNSYQIFAISHQPQLTSSANQHFLVDKTDGKSFVKELNNKEKINEIARMISGEKVTAEAIEFAKNLLK